MLLLENPTDMAHPRAAISNCHICVLISFKLCRLSKLRSADGVQGSEQELTMYRVSGCG